MNDSNHIEPFYPSWLTIAQKELGVSEIKGSKHNDRILEYHEATTLRATEDEVPWCSSFIVWCMEQAGQGSTKSAAARSWLKYGSELKVPAFCCIAVLSRGSNPKSGHVGFIVHEGKDKILLLGGNQGDKVSIASFKKSQVISYRWP